MSAGATDTGDAYVLVVTDRASHASDTLFFEHLSLGLPTQVRIVRAGGESLGAPLAGASAVVLVRSLMELGTVSSCARRFRVPRYYFLDDNFMLLREEGDPFARWFAAYSTAGVRHALRGFDGVLVATPALAEYFTAHQIHDRPLVFPPVAGPPLARPARSPDRPLTVAFFGGAHRREPFTQFVYPAIRRLAESRRVVLVVVGVEPPMVPEAIGMRVVHLPYNPSYPEALGQVARYGVDILVHPGTASANNAYKNPHVLINAWMLGAAAVFTNQPPYDAIAGEGVALLCENTEESWYGALRTLAEAGRTRADLVSRLSAYCAAHFGGDVNRDVIASILSAHTAPRGARYRQLAATACLGLGRMTQLALRAGRRVRSGTVRRRPSLG